ncbi:hypothetical protein MRX96_032559 [Rhipicephalus microplus]
MSASAHSTTLTTTHDTSGARDFTPPLDELFPAAKFFNWHTVEETGVNNDVPGSGSVHCETSFRSESTSSHDAECELSKRPGATERATSVETWIWEPGQLRSTVDTSTPSKKPPNLSWIFFFLVAVCAFLMLTTSGDSWSRVAHDQLAYGPDSQLPSTVVVFEHIAHTTAEPFRLASHRRGWRRVREICLVLLPRAPTTRCNRMAGAAYSDNLCCFFSVALEHVIELNLTSFHFHQDLDPMKLLRKETLKRLHTLSMSLCVLGCQSAVHRFLTACSDLRQLDVRIDR